MTDRKYYYVRNIVKPVGRQNVSGVPATQYEQDALDFNERLRSFQPVFTQIAKPYAQKQWNTSQRDN